MVIGAKFNWKMVAGKEVSIVFGFKGVYKMDMDVKLPQRKSAKALSAS